MDDNHTDMYPRNLPSGENFQSRARAIGINNDSHLVLYSKSQHGGLFVSGRAWWTFSVCSLDLNFYVIMSTLPCCPIFRILHINYTLFKTTAFNKQLFTLIAINSLLVKQNKVAQNTRKDFLRKVPLDLTRFMNI